MRPAVLCVASIVEVGVDGALQQREHLLRGLAGELGPGGGGVAPASQGLTDHLDVDIAAGPGGEVGLPASGKRTKEASMPAMFSISPPPGQARPAHQPVGEGDGHGSEQAGPL